MLSVSLMQFIFDGGGGHTGTACGRSFNIDFVRFLLLILLLFLSEIEKLSRHRQFVWSEGRIAIILCVRIWVKVINVQPIRSTWCGFNSSILTHLHYWAINGGGCRRCCYFFFFFFYFYFMVALWGKCQVCLLREPSEHACCDCGRWPYAILKTNG